MENFMALCMASKNFKSQTFTMIENKFITDYLPYATNNAIKVYLFGLYLCRTNALANNLDYFATSCNLTEIEIKDAFKYWQEMGIVTIVSQTPYEVVFENINEYSPIKKYKANKFESFNSQLESMFQEREISYHEYYKYYDFIDETKMQSDALLMIIKFCINMKGMQIKQPYILSVAKDWARQGVLSLSAVEEKLKEYEATSENIRLVCVAVGKKSAPDFEDKQMLLKWLNDWGFSLESVLYAGKSLKRKVASINKLDHALDEFYRLGIFEISEMQSFNKDKEVLVNLAYNVNRILGIYYDNVDFIIETYTKTWLDKGFDVSAVELIAKYCFSQSIKRLETMNEIVQNFYALGRVTVQSILEKFELDKKIEDKIKTIIKATGSARKVLAKDKEFYEVWSEQWCFSDEILLYSAELAQGKSHSFNYMNQILASWKQQKFTTLEEVKKHAPITQSSQSNTGFSNTRNYSDEEVDQIMKNISSIEDLN